MNRYLGLAVIFFMQRSQRVPGLNRFSVFSGPYDETTKTEAPYKSRCDTAKIPPPYSKTVDAEHWTIFYSPSPTVLTSTYELNIL